MFQSQRRQEDGTSLDRALASKDPLMRAKSHLEQPDEDKRCHGVDLLAKTGKREAIDLALEVMSTDSSPRVRAAAEVALVELAKRHPDRAGEIATAILDRALDPRSGTLDQINSMRRALPLLNTLVSLAGVDPDLRTSTTDRIRTWATKIETTTTLTDAQGVQMLLTGDRELMRQAQAGAIAAAEGMVRLAESLKGMSGPVSDALRMELLKDISPGPFAQLVFGTLRGHARGGEVRGRLLDIKEAWQTRGNLYAPDLRALDGALSS